MNAPSGLHPYPPPAFGIPREIAPGLLWLRLALPFRLNHVNVYLVRDGDGWLLVDAGPGDPATCAIWTGLLDGGANSPLEGHPITRILVTHHHPDHLGAAAFLAARTGAPLLMGETEYLTALQYLTGGGAGLEEVRSDFYRRQGVALDAGALAGHTARYRSLVPALPPTFRPLRDGDQIAVGDASLTVLEMPGHAPAQMLLHDAAQSRLFAGDQVLTRITPNVGVMDRNPDDDPLGRYLDSLHRLRSLVADDSLVLPGHHLPFRHLHARTRELEIHHAERCTAVVAACGTSRGSTAAELVPILFSPDLDAHQFWFAFSEVLAHLNHLARLGRIEPRFSHGRVRWGRPGRPSHTGVS